MNRYTIYCTEEQALKAYKLGAPIEVEVIYESDHDAVRDDKVHISEYLAKTSPFQMYAIIPTAEQIIGWIDEHDVLIQIYHEVDWLFSINHFEGVGRFFTREKATLAAIDAALDYLEKKEDKR